VDNFRYSSERKDPAEMEMLTGCDGIPMKTGKVLRPRLYYSRNIKAQENTVLVTNR